MVHFFNNPHPLTYLFATSHMTHSSDPPHSLTYLFARLAWLTSLLNSPVSRAMNSSCCEEDTSKKILQRLTKSEAINILLKRALRSCEPPEPLKALSLSPSSVIDLWVLTFNELIGSTCIKRVPLFSSTPSICLHNADCCCPNDSLHFEYYSSFFHHPMPLHPHFLILGWFRGLTGRDGQTKRIWYAVFVDVQFQE